MKDPALLRVLVADDEPLARRRIEDLLRHETDLELVGSVENGLATVRAIESLRPHLVFLDIQMPGMTGLEVVTTIGPERMPATVFVTAYDQHAIQAFDLAAVDYLVKPFADERFALAFKRARDRIRLEAVGQLTHELVSVLSGLPAPRGPYLSSIEVEARGGTRFLPVAEVDYIAASGPYAELHAGRQAHLIRERMQDLERQLDPECFVRIHRSTIVRLDRVDSLRQKPGGDVAVRLKDGTSLAVSRRLRDELERRLRHRP